MKDTDKQKELIYNKMPLSKFKRLPKKYLKEDRSGLLTLKLS